MGAVVATALTRCSAVSPVANFFAVAAFQVEKRLAVVSRA